MRIGVVGAGAWGLPAALELRIRGHDVTLFDRDVPAGVESSSRGTTRLWRLADPRPAHGRLLAAARDATDRLAARLGTPLSNHHGLLWRDDLSLPATARVLDDLGSAYDRISADDVGSVFPGLRSDGRDALFVHEAGALFASVLIDGAASLFLRLGGTLLPGTTIAGIHRSGGSLALEDSRGTRHEVDRVVVAAGVGAARLLHGIGVRLPLRSYLEQVVHFGAEGDPHALDSLPCVFDGPRDGQPGIYGMAAPGEGYKVGLDTPLRPTDEDDHGRTPDPARTAILVGRIARDFSEIPPVVRSAQVCAWTDSPDGQFVIDRVDEHIVLACGDAGEGFKFAALVGEHLADLVEGDGSESLRSAFGLDRLRTAPPLPRTGPTALGRS